MDGILPLFKPKGMTSHDCVYKIRKILKTKKVGHTGTLDPDVDGVLPICIGRATKIVQFLTDTNKTYEGEVTLGYSTTTEDSSGEVVESKTIEATISAKNVDRVLSAFQGEIVQVPPMYSAVKVKGKRLYEYARQGIEVERPSRKIMIYNIERIDDLHDLSRKKPSFDFKVTCSKGTYIRTLAVDIGKQLGYPAHMSALTRTASGTIGISDTYTFEQLEEQVANGQIHLLQIHDVLSELTKYEIHETLLQKVKNGAVLSIPDELVGKERFMMTDKQGTCIAIYQPHPSKDGLMKPEKVLFT